MTVCKAHPLWDDLLDAASRVVMTADASHKQWYSVQAGALEELARRIDAITGADDGTTPCMDALGGLAIRPAGAGGGVMKSMLSPTKNEATSAILEAWEISGRIEGNDVEKTRKRLMRACKYDLLNLYVDALGILAREARRQRAACCVLAAGGRR